MRTVPRLVVFVVFLAISVMLVLPVWAAPSGASNLQQYPPCPSPAAPNTHCVKPGEWIYCIGRAYQVQPWDIAYASGIPMPYGPAYGYGYYHPYYGYGYYHPYYGYFYPYYYPWNFVYPGQVLSIPFTITVNGVTRSTAWYNIPAQPVGVPCPAQFALPAGWPPPPPTSTMPYPMPYVAPY